MQPLDPQQSQSRRQPEISLPPADRIERQEQINRVRKSIDDLRTQLRLAEAEERFLRLYTEVFPPDEESESEPSI